MVNFNRLHQTTVNLIWLSIGQIRPGPVFLLPFSEKNRNLRGVFIIYSGGNEYTIQGVCVCLLDQGWFIYSIQGGGGAGLYSIWGVCIFIIQNGCIFAIQWGCLYYKQEGCFRYTGGVYIPYRDGVFIYYKCVNIL